MKKVIKTAGEKTPSAACFIEHNNAVPLAEEPLSMLGNHVGDKFSFSWPVHGKKATQPHTGWR